MPCRPADPAWMHDAEEPFLRRRDRLPEPAEPPKGIGYWELIKEYVGKDLAKVNETPDPLLASKVRGYSLVPVPSGLPWGSMIFQCQGRCALTLHIAIPESCSQTTNLTRMRADCGPVPAGVAVRAGVRHGPARRLPRVRGAAARGVHKKLAIHPEDAVCCVW